MGGTQQSIKLQSGAVHLAQPFFFPNGDASPSERDFRHSCPIAGCVAFRNSLTHGTDGILHEVAETVNQRVERRIFKCFC